MNTVINTLLLAAASAAAASCAIDTSDLDIATASDEILGGTPASNADLDAIGALAVARGNRFEPFCTGTLIAPTQVLTSEQCARRYRPTDVAFLVGPDAAHPKKTIRAIGAAAEETLTGGPGGLGSDTAIVHLARPVTGVAPLPVAKLTASLVGKRFSAIGFGVRDDHGRAGLRYRGSMQLVGIGGVQDGQRLLDGIEASFGGSNDDADLCHGDDGGPIARTQGGVLTVFGVASRFDGDCLGSVVYSIVNDAVVDLVAYQAACPLIPLEGACDGDVAVRCARPEEGGFRPLRNDCADLNQTCRVDGGLDTVTCVDPT